MKNSSKSSTPIFSDKTKLFLAAIFVLISIIILAASLSEPYMYYALGAGGVIIGIGIAIIIFKILWFILKKFPILTYKSLYQYFFLIISVYTGGVYLALVQDKMDISFTGEDTWLLYGYYSCVAVIFLISLVKTLYHHFIRKAKLNDWNTISLLAYLALNSFLLYWGGKYLFLGLTVDTTLDDIYPKYSNPTLFAITGGLFLLTLVDFSFLSNLWNKLWSKENSLTIPLGYKEGSEYHFNTPTLKWLTAPIWKDYKVGHKEFKISDLYVKVERQPPLPPIEKLTPKQEKERRIVLYFMVSVAVYAINFIFVSALLSFWLDLSIPFIVSIFTTLYCMYRFHKFESTHRGWGRRMLRKFQKLQYLEEPLKKQIKIPKILNPLLVINEVLVAMIKVMFHLMGIFLLFFFGGEALTQLHKLPSFTDTELLDKIFMAGLGIFLGFLFFIYLYSSMIDFIRTIYWKEKK